MDNNLKSIIMENNFKDERIKALEKQLDWFNSFVDYVQDNANNIYNEACEWADDLEKN